MKTSKFLLVFSVFFLLTAERGYAQSALIVQEKVSISSVLAGHVNVGLANEPAKGVTVDLCSQDWKTVITSTKTDEHGYFSLGKPATGELFYIRLSAPGINPYELRVCVKKHGPQGLTIHLSVAT